jgi:FtsH-binding integral membrane protein
MQDNMNALAPVSSLAVSDRSEFIWKCYAHVVGAIIAVAVIETYLFQSGVAWAIAGPMMQSPMLVLMAFIGLSWGASHLAHRLESKTSQYAAFAAFVVTWSLMFVPMLAIAMVKSAESGSNIVESAASVTIFGCVALIATAMITRRDFSFLRGILVWGFFIAMGLIGASFLFGWNLGTWFSILRTSMLRRRWHCSAL